MNLNFETEGVNLLKKCWKLLPCAITTIVPFQLNELDGYFDIYSCLGKTYYYEDYVFQCIGTI